MLFALLIPVIFALGSIVMSVGNWYVLKRHLQTAGGRCRARGRGLANSAARATPQQKITAAGQDEGSRR